MRICVISSTIFSVPIRNYGGLEEIAYQCARGLAARGHDVTLIAPQGSECAGCEMLECLPPGHGEEQAWGGCVYKNPNGEDVRWPGYWPKLLEFNDGGCVIDHSWAKWSYMLKAEGRLTAPILGVMHAPCHTMYKDLPPVDKPCMVCISEDQRAHFEALHSPRTARTCYNGADGEFYKPLDTPRGDRFLYLARFSTIKGPDIALRACKDAGVGLDLIGDTSITNEPELFERCKQMADGKQLRIVGPVSRGETVWWYSQALALLHPNERFREPFGLAPVEAMLCGCPTVAWDYGAMRETICPAISGLLVRDYDALVGAIKHYRANPPTPGNRVACRDWALGYSVDRMVERYEELCKEAVKGGW